MFLLTESIKKTGSKTTKKRWKHHCLHHVDVWTLVSATHSFFHAKILTVLVMLHVALCCIRPDKLHLLQYDAIGRYRLCRACYIINMLFYNFER